jgi:hypothetical protein
MAVDLHRFSGPASVLSEITSRPIDPLSRATLELSAKGYASRRRDPAPGPWVDEMETDAYTIWQLRAIMQPGDRLATKVYPMQPRPPFTRFVVRWP